MAERDITADEAWAILQKHGGYGAVRVYGIYAEPSEFAGQIKAIKSSYHLTAVNYSRIYAVSNDGTGMPPIRKA